jgi:hypothetical protein
MEGKVERNLEKDLLFLLEQKVKVLVTLNEQKELEHCNVSNIASVCESVGITHVHFPFADMSVPKEESANDFVLLISKVV